MASKRSSNGKCVFCSKVFPEAQMSGHLQSCENRKIADEKTLSKTRAGGKTGKVFGIKIRATYDPAYWLFIEARAGAMLADLDVFLRNIWVECCGHLSQFSIGEKSYAGGAYGEELEPGMMDAESMDIVLSKVLSLGEIFHYEYDFGDTTHLNLEAVWERKGPVKTKVTLLARNEPAAFKCSVCGASARSVCQECGYEGEAFFCDQCAPKHKCGEEMFLPVVNSPRMGVCGYEG